jgi:hypothetical protein
MARPGLRRHPRLGRALGAGLAALLVVLGMAGPVAGAAQSWTVSANSLIVPLNASTTVRLTITNTSGDGGGGAGIGCVMISIPSAYYAVTGARVVSVSRGPWVPAITSSPHGVKAQADSNNHRLRGDPDDDVLVLDVDVFGKALALLGGSWTANEYQGSDCSGNFNHPISILMTVVGVPLPTSKPTPSPTPDPTPTPSRTPSPTPTRTPTPTPTPIVTLPPIPTPGLTPTPSPSPSTRPSGAPSSTPGATPRPASSPTPGSSTAPGAPGSGAGSPGSGSPGAGGAGGGGGPGPSERPLEVSAADPNPNHRLETTAGVPGFTFLDWAVPGVILTGPGLLLLVLIAAQAVGALAWLPVVRKRMGAFGFGRRRRAPGPT